MQDPPLSANEAELSTKPLRRADPPTVEEVAEHEAPGASPRLAGGSLNLKQAAALLGVHYMTAYRYVRQGRLVAERDGTQWRVTPGALAAFTSTPNREASGDGAGGAPVAWDSRVESCLLAGDETAAWGVVELALAAGRSPTSCYLDVVAGALSSIGERWAAGEIDVAEQYLATAVAVRLVSRLGARFRRPGRSRGTVVFGAPPGELHSLPIAIVSDLVRLSGFDVLELGANVPAEAFVSSVVRTPRLVCVGVGVSRPELLGAAQQVIDAVRAVDAHVPIVLGGLVVTEFPQVVLRGVTACANDGRHAVALVEAFAPARTIHRAG